MYVCMYVCGYACMGVYGVMYVWMDLYMYVGEPLPDSSLFYVERLGEDQGEGVDTQPSPVSFGELVNNQ